MINNICHPILAITPFNTALISQGDIGRVGLSGPNVELIAFNSGDVPIEGFLLRYVVGLSFAMEIMLSNSIAFPQLGIPINQPGVLNNFEIGFTIGNNTSEVSIEYSLLVVRSLNNTGSDYAVPVREIIFTGLLIMVL